MDTTHTHEFIEDEAFIQLFSKRPETIKPGLDRIRPAWKKLGMDRYPQFNILVAGTNGKGSTAGFLWHLFAAHGIKAGVITSPHLCRFAERFRCTHHPSAQAELKQSLYALKTELGKELYAELSFFEVSTLLALRVFNEQACTVNILEVGLGGRLDSTNIVKPAISIVCSIDLDHTEWLGSELTSICKEKLGICREDVPLFWGERFTKEKNLSTTLEEHQRKLGMPVFTREQHFGLDQASQKVWSELGLRTEALLPTWVSESSEVIQHNFALAYGAYQFIKNQTNLLGNTTDLDPSASFSSPHLPWPPSLVGRFQKLKIDLKENDSLSITLDVCHNPAAAKQFVASYHKSGMLGKIPGLVSILGDKDVTEILEILGEVLSPIYFFEIESERGKLDQRTESYVRSLFSIQKNLRSCWELVRREHPNKNYAICGSFLAVADALRLFSAYPKHGQFSAELNGYWN